jgi:hypothetical protein
MIETESGRGEVYQTVIPGGYSVIPMTNNFSPKEFGLAISAAEEAKVDALIVDSASHEWEGIHGVLNMAADNQAAGKKGPIVWQVPKMDHAREFVLRLMQTPIPLVIVCMRAKYPMVEVIKDNKKEWARSKDLDPKQSEDILYEMMIHGWIDEQHNFHLTKYPGIETLKGVIENGKPISEETGKRLSSWAAGGVKAPAPTPSPTQAPEIDPSPANESAIADFSAAMNDCRNMDELKDAWTSAFTWSKSCGDTRAKGILQTVYEARKAVLSGND